jgi:hypothetical protein
MSAVMEQVTDVTDITPAHRPAGGALTTAMNPGQLVNQLVQQGGTLDLAAMERLMGLQERWEANEARKAYNVAFAAFKAEAVRILKNQKVTDGPLKNKSYAELHSVVDAVTPALSRHGLSASWRLTRDEKDWIEVTCKLEHTGGHSESVSMGGPPDAGGAKNAIQARASSVTYLSRYTLKAITGVAEGGEDDDGNGGAPDTRLDLYTLKAAAASTMEELQAVYNEAKVTFKAHPNVDAWNSLKAAVADRKAVLEGGAK